MSDPNVSVVGERVWSAYQQAIFRVVSEERCHVFVDALAGSGKSTVLEECFGLVPRDQRAVAIAFNKTIADALAGRLRRRGIQNVQASTCHSFGFSAIRSAIGQVNVDKWKLQTILAELHGDEERTRERRKTIAKLASLAKGYLATTEDDVDRIIDLHEIDIDPEFRERFCAATLEAMRVCKERTETIDFDDMVWLPIVLGLRLRQSDVVFVDEVQDLNPAQIELAMRAAKDDGRIVAVGDEWQAIYGFRGADQDGVQKIKDRLDAGRFGVRVLPLSITYRCASSIVAVANEIVPHLEAAPAAPAGLVERMNEAKMIESARPGDFILSRSNAPLVKLCLGFLKANRRATIAGRDMGGSLLLVVEKSKAADVPALTKFVVEWAKGERARLAAKGRDTDVVDDREETLHALCEGARTVGEVEARIESLFSDTSEGEKIVLSSTHRAKGLERDRVFVLANTYRRRPGPEEDRLWYVAVTRAKTELYLVTLNQKTLEA